MEVVRVEESKTEGEKEKWSKSKRRRPRKSRRWGRIRKRRCGG